MIEAPWARRARPTVGSDVVTVGRWELATPADLTTHRRQLAAALHDGAHPPGMDDGAVPRLLLAFGELASNALRHGCGPVRVSVTAVDGSWLLDVSDAAVDRPPRLAVDRDAAQGGLGLYLVARMCEAHGWTVVGDRKHVWACIDYTRAGSRSGPVLRPREEIAGRSSVP
jgi:Histidine kinase-like ATPase domain